MDLRQFIKSGDYVAECKKHRVQYRKYPRYNLMVMKRAYGSPYSEDTPWLNYCRGLVIDYEQRTLVFCPPPKSQELSTFDDIAAIGDTTDTYTELIDGTMLNLFYHADSDEWLLSTRSTIGGNNQWTVNMSFKQMFDECGPGLDYQAFSKSCTYSFVMRHTNNRILTPVKDNELYLVEVREQGIPIYPLPECPEQRYRIPIPISYDNLSKDAFSHMYKGYTLTKGGMRYKWMTDDCKFIQMIKPNTNNPFLNYLMLRHSGHLTQYLRLFPEDRFTFASYRKKVHDLTKLVHHFYTNVFIHKQVDKQDVPFCLKPFIYELHGQYLQTKQGISWKDVKQYIHTLEPKRLCFALNNL